MPRDPTEPVRLTRIYTRGGDKGETSLGDGSRVSKLDPRVAAMGDVDELNSLIGWADGLDRIQNELFDLGADMSVPFAGNEERLRITDEAIERLEQEIEAANAALPELKSFVLPGGAERAARLFFARAVCRRAERAVLAVPDTNPLAAVYLNRLSDLLFVLSRAANAEAGDFEQAIKWEKKYLETTNLAATNIEQARIRLGLYQAHKPYREEKNVTTGKNSP